MATGASTWCQYTPMFVFVFSQYPGMLSGCNISWMCDWPQEPLLGVSTLQCLSLFSVSTLVCLLGCNISWMCDWPQEPLLGVSTLQCLSLFSVNTLVC